MSDWQPKTSPEGYTLCRGGSCQHGEYAVKKRARFILDNLSGNNQRVLDVGCGIGVYFESLSRVASEITGIDLNQDYLNQAMADAGRMSRTKIILLLCDAEKLPFQPDYFDTAVMIETLEHIPDDEKAIQEVARVLKPGGKLILTAPNKWFPFETHGIRIRTRVIRFPFSLLCPFTPYLPSVLRKSITQARVYTPGSLNKVLEANKLQPTIIGFLAPSLDVPERRFPRFSSGFHFARKFLDVLEGSFLSRFVGSTIIICAQKLADPVR